MGLFDSLFGSKSSSTSSIPKYLENASKDLINRGTKLVDKGKYTPYTGPTVAGKNSFYGKAENALLNQRGLASENMAQADAILDRTKAGTKNYYGDVDAALDRVSPLSGDYFSGAAGAAGNIRALDRDYLAGAGSAVNNLRALDRDYFDTATNTLRGIDRGASIYNEADGILDTGSSKFMGGMKDARGQIGEAMARGGQTQGAIGKFGQLPGIVNKTQGRAEDLQLKGNAGLRSTLGREMGESGTGYDESAGLTRKASRLDSTNKRAINDRINPYTEAVTDMALRDYGKQRDISGKKINDAAQAAGAFGGSRHGVAQGMFDQETSKGVSDIVTSQREKGYDAATRRLDSDRANLLSSAGQLAGTQTARDAGTLGFTSQIGDLTERDASLIRQGGLDAAGATKDAAAGAMSGEKQLFDMDSDAAKMLKDLATGYSDESRATSAAKLAAQGQRFGQDMSFAEREEALARDRLTQQGQQFGQNKDIYSAKSDLAKNLLAQQEQKFNQSKDVYGVQSDLGKSRLTQQGQKFNQGMDIVAGREALAKGELGQEQQRFGQNMTLADMQRQLGLDDQKSRQAEAADLLGYGKETRAITQAEFDAKKARFDEKEQYPYEQLNWLSSIIGGQPYSRSTTSSKSEGAGNSILSALTTGLGSFLSDENEKENRVDADVEDILASFRKMPVDDYDYKDRAVDSGAAPDGRRTGPMAQDWAKEFGGDGKTVDIAQMLGKLAGAVKGLEERTREEPKPREERGLPRRKVA